SSSAPKGVVDDIYWPALQKWLEAKGVKGGDFIAESSLAYSEQMDAAVNKFSEDAPRKLGGQLDTALQNGWIHAGSYYLVLARMNQAVQKEASPSVGVSTDSEASPRSEKSP